MSLNVSTIAILSPLICCLVLVFSDSIDKIKYSAIWSCAFVLLCCTLLKFDVHNNAFTLLYWCQPYLVCVVCFFLVVILLHKESHSSFSIIYAALIALSMSLCAFCSHLVLALVPINLITNLSLLGSLNWRYHRNVSIRWCAHFLADSVLMFIVCVLNYIIGLEYYSYILMLVILLLRLPILSLCDTHVRLYLTASTASKIAFSTGWLMQNCILYYLLSRQFTYSSVYIYNIVAIYTIIATTIYCALRLFMRCNRDYSLVYILIINNCFAMIYMLKEYNYILYFRYYLHVIAANVLILISSSITKHIANNRIVLTDMLVFIVLYVQLNLMRLSIVRLHNIFCIWLYLILTAIICVAIINEFKYQDSKNVVSLKLHAHTIIALFVSIIMNVIAMSSGVK